MHFADGRFGGWMRDAAWWNRARDLLAKELSRQVDKGAAEEQSSLDSTEWKSLLAGPPSPAQAGKVRNRVPPARPI